MKFILVIIGLIEGGLITGGAFVITSMISDGKTPWFAYILVCFCCGIFLTLFGMLGYLSFDDLKDRKRREQRIRERSDWYA